MAAVLSVVPSGFAPYCMMSNVAANDNPVAAIEHTTPTVPFMITSLVIFRFIAQALY